MKKILITGASGYLANSLVAQAAECAEVIGVARRSEAIADPAQSIALDITQRKRVLDVIVNEKPDAIIHCAASNPGSDETSMLAVNESGSAYVAEAAAQLGCRLVAVSSDTVLNGIDAPFADNAPSSPLPENTYAVSKACAEHQLLSIYPATIVVRTSLIYGLHDMDRGTAGFVKRLDAGEKLRLFTDVIRQPVFDQSLSEHLCSLAVQLTEECGAMNIVGDEACSRFEFGKRMLDHWGIEYGDSLEAVSGVGVAGLPLDLTMRQVRAKALGFATPGVSEVLRSARR